VLFEFFIVLDIILRTQKYHITQALESKLLFEDHHKKQFDELFFSLNGTDTTK
jgi:hypothetical protein